MKTEGMPVTIGSRLAKIAKRLGEKTAIVEGDDSVSYAELAGLHESATVAAIAAQIRESRATASGAT